MSLSHQQLLDLYGYMVAARESDIVEAELVKSGEANFLAAGTGHEGSAILAPYLIPEDYVHCHYRDKALMLARGISNEMFFLSALCKANSHSAGRQMVSHMSAPEHNILSIVGPVGNNGLQAAGIAHIIKSDAKHPIVICSFGDGMSQQGEMLEAIAEAERDNLPVLFFIHDNELAISTRTTGKTFFDHADGTKPTEFHGVAITHIDGKKPLESADTIGTMIDNMRQDRKPQIIIFKVDRLANHSNADDQQLYRSDAEIAQSHAQNDPITNTEAYLKSIGIDQGEITVARDNAKLDVRTAVDKARNAPEPEAVYSASKPLPKALESNQPENRGDFDSPEDRYTMLAAVREGLRHHLNTNDKVVLLGEDLEDGKGDVFGMTKGLSTQFPGRVRNSALSESTIMGVAGGMALAGARPVAFLQFADFMPLAYNQLMAEIGSMYWRTNGGWECPVIVMAACGAYRPGLGPFHSQTNEATLAHIPGVDVFMPSTASDAVGVLNAAFASKRPSVILYPKKLLNNSGLQDTTAKDIQNRLIPIGKARVVQPGQDITLIGWGNTVEICQQTADALEGVGLSAEVIDLRTINPYDLTMILASVDKTRHVIVAHEDNHTCGVGGELLAAIAEHSRQPVKAKRITRPDTLVPCNFPNQLTILPSFERMLTAAAEMLNLDLTWEETGKIDTSRLTVDVIGASPSDESVMISELHINIGDEIKAGQKLADTEASKSAGEILAPANGTVESIHVAEGERANVGEPLIIMKLAQSLTPAQQLLQSRKKPILTRQAQKSSVKTIDQNTQRVHSVGISLPEFVTGSRQVSNDDLLKNFPEHTSEDIIQRTGIENRYWLAEGETPAELAAKAAKALLDKHGLQLSQISQVVCCTDSPYEYIAPSTACLVLNKLYEYYGEQSMPAYDMNAACSGYIYGLQQARDYLQARPEGILLLLTAEALSTRVNQNDFETAFLFADAMTATLVLGENHLQHAKARLDHTLLFAEGENGENLSVPNSANDGKFIHMAGKTIFTNAVKKMAMAMMRCCNEQGIDIHDLGLIVPHQANDRIAKAVEKRLKLKDGTMYSNVARYGNTSSSTIPIGLAETLGDATRGTKVGIAAFGGGFTFGAGVLEVIQ